MDEKILSQEFCATDETSMLLRTWLASDENLRLTNTGRNNILPADVSRPTPRPPQFSVGDFFKPSDNIYYRKVERGVFRQRGAYHEQRITPMTTQQRRCPRLPPSLAAILATLQLIPLSVLVYLLVLTTTAQVLLRGINNNERALKEANTQYSDLVIADLIQRRLIENQATRPAPSSVTWLYELRVGDHQPRPSTIPPRRVSSHYRARP